jgi:PTH1 family peptidyl-tRNA hydrolase
MNLSGQAVAPLLKEFSLKPDRLLIVADELDLPLGRLQLKPKGGTAGHNGHKSIKALIGTEDYPRLRFGINSDRKEETIDFVLSKFHPEERPDIQQLLRKAITGIETLVEQGIERAQNVVNES